MVNAINFKSENSNIVSFNNPQRVQQVPVNVSMPEDMFIMEEMAKKQRKREKSQDRLQKIGVYSTAGIAFALLGSFLFKILAMTKFGKSAASGAEKELTSAKLLWEDFKGKKLVADLNSSTTAKSLREAFNNIIYGSKLSEKALKWGGGQAKKSDVIYLYGHGGVGKTYVAKQYAQEIGAIFTSVKYPDIGSPYKDAASMKISNMFDQIIDVSTKNSDRPVVVCIDEFDAVIKKVNDAAHGSEEASKSRAAILTGIDRVKEKCSNVTFIATSNYHPKNGIVDEIVLRRFNNQVEVPLPDKEQIEGLLKMYLKDIGAINPDEFFKKSEVKNFINKLQKEGYSNGEVELISQEAGKIFRSTLKDVKDEDLVKHPFKVEFLEKALKMKGDAACKTNRLMDVNTNSNLSEMPKLNFLQKLLILFGRNN